jgi:hypothetical protein
MWCKYKSRLPNTEFHFSASPLVRHDFTKATKIIYDNCWQIFALLSFFTRELCSFFVFSSTLHVYVNCINLERVSVMQNVFWGEVNWHHCGRVCFHVFTACSNALYLGIWCRSCCLTDKRWPDELVPLLLDFLKVTFSAIVSAMKHIAVLIKLCNYVYLCVHMCKVFDTVTCWPPTVWENFPGEAPARSRGSWFGEV